MAILRKVKKNNYTTIDNSVFKNKELSLKAKGMLCTMLSLPDDWEFSEIGLTELSNDSRTSIRSALKELMEFGYLTRTRIRDEKGKLANAEYTIYEEPMYQKPTLEKPMLVKKHNKILNNKVLNNKENINNINIINTKESKKFKKPTLEEVKEYCLERNNQVDAEQFIDFYESKGWVVGKNSPMKDWKACVRTWEKGRTSTHKETRYEREKRIMEEWLKREED